VRRRLLAVSRTTAPVGDWIQADLSELTGIEAVEKAIGAIGQVESLSAIDIKSCPTNC
jgi:hypothetical protein